MPSTRVHFDNGRGQRLAVRLELPVDRRPRFFALFAHCFTCTKNLGAVRRVTRALTWARAPTTCAWPRWAPARL